MGYVHYWAFLWHRWRRHRAMSAYIAHTDILRVFFNCDMEA